MKIRSIMAIYATGLLVGLAIGAIIGHSAGWWLMIHG
jgi:hypothetical protein